MNPAGAVPATTLATEFESSYADLVRFLSHHGSRGDEARDLAHDLWLRLAEGRVAPPSHPRAYLFGTARHLLIDRARRDGHHAAWLSDASLRQPGSAPDVADGVAHRQALDAVARALQALPDRTRDAFLAHRLDGAGHEELASRHGVTRSTIERDIQRAQQQVRGAIERWHGAEAARAPARRRTLAALLGVAGVGLATPLAWRLWQTQVPRWHLAAGTPRGHIATHTLPDGSRMTLDADSAIEATYYGSRRVLRLRRGGAWFAVQPDAKRPFDVQAGHTLVTVLGTRFSVEFDEDRADGHESAVGVAVESGRVRVQTDGSADVAELRAGESLRVAVDRSMRRTPTEARSVAAWREGWLSFSATPLGIAARRLGRYRREAPEVAELPVSGEVRIAQADEWLRLLPRMLPVRVNRAPDGAVELLPR